MGFVIHYSPTLCLIKSQTTAGPGRSPPQDLIRTGVVRPIEPKQASSVITSEGYKLLDIRPAWEWEKARVKSAIHIPLFLEDTDSSPITFIKKFIHFGYIGLWTGQLLTTINADFLDEVQTAFPDKDEKLLVACGEGLRSRVAVSALHKDGYQNLGWLAGGFSRASEKDFADVEGQSKLQYATVGGVSYIFLRLLILLRVLE